MANELGSSKHIESVVTGLVEAQFSNTSTITQTSPARSLINRLEPSPLDVRSIVPTTITVAVQTSITTIQISFPSQLPPWRSQSSTSSSNAETIHTTQRPPLLSPSGMLGPKESISKPSWYNDPDIVSSSSPFASSATLPSQSLDHSTSCKIAIAILSTAGGIAIITVIALLYYSPKRWKARGARTRDEELAKIQKESDDWKGRYELLCSNRGGDGVSWSDHGPRPGTSIGTSTGIGGSVSVFPFWTGHGMWR